ncbi:MAG: 2-oxoacid:acceptor oxidoreductase family protein [Deltaproteobacteria bacterium]|nr:2-oxoacid:acceptor oxidoreductase family protein [Deltaproteobacteria bacterium]
MMASLQKELVAQLKKGEALDLRADGKAGSGLVMTLQVFAEAVSLEGTYQVQEWPFFSSARKGANVRGFMRVGKGPLFMTCQVESPHVALLFTEKTGEEIDFASGVSKGIFVLNTAYHAIEAAQKFRLRGEVFTVSGDRLGQEYLHHPIPNISVLAALHKALPLVSVQQVVQALKHNGEKRRLPLKAIQANQDCLLASLKEVSSAVVQGEEAWEHPLPSFAGYEGYPIGAQSALRSSLQNLTANYARTGRRLVFQDPQDRCTGCSLCIVNCPEGIIQFVPDEKRGIRVTGADVNHFCKLCRECIEACPLDLFEEVEGALV